MGNIEKSVRNMGYMVKRLIRGRRCMWIEIREKIVEYKYLNS